MARRRHARPDEEPQQDAAGRRARRLEQRVACARLVVLQPENNYDWTEARPMRLLIHTTGLRDCLDALSPR